MSLLDDDSLPHLISIQHVSYALDAQGGDTPTDATAYAASQPAWIQPASAASIKDFATRNMRVTHDIYLNEDPGLRLDDIVTPTSGPYSGHAMVIRGFRECTAGVGMGWLISCEEDMEAQ